MRYNWQWMGPANIICFNIRFELVKELNWIIDFSE